MMAPMAATLADDAAIDNVVAYIDDAAGYSRRRPRSRAMPQNGAARYVTCGACHGADGRGIAATNAPRLKGMSDWYMVTQLKNFSDGVRGAHPQDLYGAQMALMAAMLARRSGDRRRRRLHQHADETRLGLNRWGTAT